MEQRGVKIFYGHQEANASIEENGRILAGEIRRLAEENGIEKFNVIAHSKGGLDIRYAISQLGIGSYIASLTTMSTPHNGSRTVDALLKCPDAAVRAVGWFTDVWMRICGDKNPASYEVFHSLSTEFARKFNEQNPDSTGIYYQSFAFVMKYCFSDMLLFLPYLVVAAFEGKNDGLLAPRAVRWGEFRGIYTGAGRRGVSHCDEVDLRRHALSRKPAGENEISDMPGFYCRVVRELGAKGF